MKNILCLGLVMGLVLAMSLPVMAQSDEPVNSDVIDTSVSDDVIVDDIIVSDEDNIVAPNPDGTIGVEDETESTSPNWWSAYGIWWAIGIIVVVGAGLLFTKKS